MTDSAVQILVVRTGSLARWPEPLETLVAWGQVHLEMVSNLHAAAASLIQAPCAIDVLLVDVQNLTPGEIRLLTAFKRHKSLSIWLLPATSSRVKLAQAQSLGALPWDCAIQEMAQWPQVAPTRMAAQGSSRILEKLPIPKKAHSGEVPADSPADFAVTFDLMTGYDAASASLVSDRKIHALLGMATLEV